MVVAVAIAVFLVNNIIFHNTGNDFLTENICRAAADAADEESRNPLFAPVMVMGIIMVVLLVLVIVLAIALHRLRQTRKRRPSTSAGFYLVTLLSVIVLVR